MPAKAAPRGFHARAMSPASQMESEERSCSSGCAIRRANMARRSRANSSRSWNGMKRRDCSRQPGVPAAASRVRCCSRRESPTAARRVARAVLPGTSPPPPPPPMDEELHDEALARGLIRYCPICDGYEVTDEAVGVIGDDAHRVAEAVFLRGFPEDSALIAPDAAHDFGEEDRARLEQYGIKTVDGPCSAVAA